MDQASTCLRRPGTEAPDSDARLQGQHRRRDNRQTAQQLPAVCRQALRHKRVVRLREVHLSSKALSGWVDIQHGKIRGIAVCLIEQRCRHGDCTV